MVRSTGMSVAFSEIQGGGCRRVSCHWLNVAAWESFWHILLQLHYHKMVCQVLTIWLWKCQQIFVCVCVFFFFFEAVLLSSTCIRHPIICWMSMRPSPNWARPSPSAGGNSLCKCKTVWLGNVLGRLIFTLSLLVGFVMNWLKKKLHHHILTLNMTSKLVGLQEKYWEDSFKNRGVFWWPQVQGPQEYLNPAFCQFLLLLRFGG